MRNHAHSNRYYNGIRKDFVHRGALVQLLVTRRIISFSQARQNVVTKKKKHTHIHTNRSWLFPSNDFMMASHTWLCLHMNKCIQFKYTPAKKKKRKRPGINWTARSHDRTIQRPRDLVRKYNKHLYTVGAHDDDVWKRKMVKKERDSTGVYREREPCFVFRLSHQDPHIFTITSSS